jgi:hypothetical protein
MRGSGIERRERTGTNRSVVVPERSLGVTGLLSVLLDVPPISSKTCSARTAHVLASCARFWIPGSDRNSTRFVGRLKRNKQRSKVCFARRTKRVGRHKAATSAVRRTCSVSCLSPGAGRNYRESLTTPVDTS